MPNTDTGAVTAEMAEGTGKAGDAADGAADPAETAEGKNPQTENSETENPRSLSRVGIGPLSSIGEDLRSDTPVQGAMLANAIGGWRGVVDSALPSLVFVIAYLTTSQNLTTSIWAAVVAGVVIALWRILRKQSLQQVLGGFAGVAISAWLAARTGSAADFFLPGLLINVVYGLAFIVSNVVRWPIVGLVVGAATGDIAGWRKDSELYRAYRLATWIWAGMFGLRLVVQLPLYFAESVGALGIAKIALGWPLMLIVGLWTYRLVKPAIKHNHERAKAAKADGDEDTDDN